MESPDPLDLLYDAAITSHGFARSMRDYLVVVERWAEGEHGDRSTYVFTHCVFAETSSALSGDTWTESWDTPTDLGAWDEAGSRGIAWGVEWANVEGASQVPNSPRASEWSGRLNRPMREAVIETNVFTLKLVFSEIRIEAPA